MCKLTEGFQALYELTSDEQYIKAKKKTADFYENAEYIECTHPLGYAYVSGVIQLGIILFKMGYMNEARKICEYGRVVQSMDESGGLFQYAKEDGSLDDHVHTEINSWGTKYFCQLEAML